AAFSQAWADAGPVGKIALFLRTIADELFSALAGHASILHQDLRYTVRTLNRTRGFALTAIVVTALGVGANTAAFSAADFVLFRPLPFPAADRPHTGCDAPPQ